MTGRRKARALSAAERSLWHDWARRTAVVPLPGKALEPAPTAPPAAVQPTAPTPTPIPAAPRKPPPPVDLHVGIAPSGLDDKRWRDLRRGRTRPERTLDLHGLRAQEAHHAVRGFVRASAAEGLRCIAIVTGRGSTPEGGILRRELPHWLNAADIRPLLLGAAHPHASNAGAVHVLLRRRR